MQQKFYSVTPSIYGLSRTGSDAQTRRDLHDFMQWHRPILTDSGGFKYSKLGKLRKITGRRRVVPKTQVTVMDLPFRLKKSMEILQYDFNSDIRNDFR